MFIITKGLNSPLYISKGYGGIFVAPLSTTILIMTEGTFADRMKQGTYIDRESQMITGSGKA